MSVQKNHQSSKLLVCVRVIRRWLVVPQKEPVMRKELIYHDFAMCEMLFCVEYKLKPKPKRPLHRCPAAEVENTTLRQ